jgi:outer membrane receptor for monomeric catechols
VDGKQDRYKVDTVTSSKITTPLLDAPQSISVVPRAVLEEQNAQSLQEVLRNVPGITFMSGEGNLGWGDLFSIRGFAAEQSMTVDGVRDAGMASRNDTFNLEQAEVYKGTGSVESGVGRGRQRQPGQQARAPGRCRQALGRHWHRQLQAPDRRRHRRSMTPRPCAST